MKVIESSYEILEEQDPIKAIEAAGRTCYKSEDKITEDSAVQFVEMIKGRGHGAMLEHGTVYLEIEGPWNVLDYDEVGKYVKNPYSKVVGPVYSRSDYVEGQRQYSTAYIATNYRVLVENGWLDDLKYACEPTEHHERRVSVRFICDRGVSHELVRHRVFSFAQESTRFCNYSKDKFGNELTFILPDWAVQYGIHNVQFFDTCARAEEAYLQLLESGYKPQQARQVLPNALKTEIVMTGFVSDWKGVFKLRCAENAHPDMRKLMIPLEAEFKNRGYI